MTSTTTDRPRRMILTARDAARDLIERYVARGDSLQTLKDSHMGRACGLYWAAIAGCFDGRCYGPEWIVVQELLGEPCGERVHLPRLYQEIADELAGGYRQGALL